MKDLILHDMHNIKSAIFCDRFVNGVGYVVE